MNKLWCLLLIVAAMLWLAFSALSTARRVSLSDLEVRVTRARLLSLEQEVAAQKADIDSLFEVFRQHNDTTMKILLPQAQGFESLEKRVQVLEQQLLGLLAPVEVEATTDD